MKINASGKIALVILLMLLGAFGPLGSGLLVLAACACAYALCKKSIFLQARKHLLLLLVFLLPALVFALLFEGSVQVLGREVPKWAAMGANSFSYLCGIFLLWALLLERMRMQEVQEALLSLHFPKEAAFMLPVAVYGAKSLREKMRSIRIAQAARGGEGVFSLLVPFFNSIFMRAKSLALSLESRGFSGEDL